MTLCAIGDCFKSVDFDRDLDFDLFRLCVIEFIKESLTTSDCDLLTFDLVLRRFIRE